MNNQKKVNKIIENMSVEEKVGQCMVIGWGGTVVTPKILERIRKFNPAGVRVSQNFRAKTAVHDPYAVSGEFAHRVVRNPEGTIKDIVKGVPTPYCTVDEFCEYLNTMKKAALEGSAKIPLHITFDMEGDNTADFVKGDVHSFPSNMGIGLAGDKTTAYDVGWASARQAVATGISWIHSPVLDVNTNPLNPEIGTRSFSSDADEAAEYSVEAFKGYRDGGLITTGKHFPGRGASQEDAHAGLPIIDIDREEMEEHLKPFQALVDEGIPCIMIAHTAYPSLDPSGLPATVSKPILTDLLKEKMGFKGVITTDDITMGGIVSLFEVHEACINAINAGADLILIREEAGLVDEVFEKLVEAVKTGEISEGRINDAVSRTLSVKFEYSLFEDNGIKDPQKAVEAVKDKKVERICVDSACNTMNILRDENNVLPLKEGTKVLLVEQMHPLHLMTNSQKCHPGLIWENMLKVCDNVGQVETTLEYNKDDRERVMKRVDEADVIVMTNYYFRRFGYGDDFVEELHKKLDKPIVVITNSPYPFVVKDEYKTVILTYSGAPEAMVELTKLVYGKKHI